MGSNNQKVGTETKECPTPETLYQALRMGINAVWGLQHCNTGHGEADRDDFVFMIAVLNNAFAYFANTRDEQIATHSVHPDAVTHKGYLERSYADIALRIMFACKFELFILDQQYRLPEPSEPIDPKKFLDLDKVVEAVVKIPEFNIEQLGLCLLIEHERATTGKAADSKADNTKKNKKLPRNHDVPALAALINNRTTDGRKQIGIALEFTKGNKSRAQSLLRQVRRFKLLEV